MTSATTSTYATRRGLVRGRGPAGVRTHEAGAVPRRPPRPATGSHPGPGVVDQVGPGLAGRPATSPRQVSTLITRSGYRSRTATTNGTTRRISSSTVDFRTDPGLHPADVDQVRTLGHGQVHRVQRGAVGPGGTPVVEGVGRPVHDGHHRGPVGRHRSAAKHRHRRRIWDGWRITDRLPPGRPRWQSATSSASPSASSRSTGARVTVVRDVVERRPHALERQRRTVATRPAGRRPAAPPPPPVVLAPVPARSSSRPRCSHRQGRRRPRRSGRAGRGRPPGWRTAPPPRPAPGRPRPTPGTRPEVGTGRVGAASASAEPGNSSRSSNGLSAVAVLQPGVERGTAAGLRRRRHRQRDGGSGGPAAAGSSARSTSAETDSEPGRSTSMTGAAAAARSASNADDVPLPTERVVAAGRRRTSGRPSGRGRCAPAPPRRSPSVGARPADRPASSPSAARRSAGCSHPSARRLGRGLGQHADGCGQLREERPRPFRFDRPDRPSGARRTAGCARPGSGRHRAADVPRRAGRP